MSKDRNSADSLIDATRSRAEFSGHGNAMGASGVREMSFDPENCEYLREPGQSIAVSSGPDGFEEILIGAAWDPVVEKRSGLLGKLTGATKKTNVDLDLGCLYELADGTRGAIQAFGEKFGAFDKPPFIALSGDERTGDASGNDEVIRVNGKHWNEIKRLVVYVYIYNGVTNWAQINPRVILDVPGEEDLVVSLGSHDDSMDLCAVGGLENVRGGIKLTNFTEYFPGHPSMDRAFGFGLDWGDGQKS